MEIGGVNIIDQRVTLDAGNTLSVVGVSGQTNPVTAFSTGTAYLYDVKASGVDGGGFTSGADQRRTLNTLVSGTVNVNWISLVSNQFTLQPGVYKITAAAPAVDVNRHQAWLHNETDNVRATDPNGNNINGTCAFVSNAGGSYTTESIINSVFSTAIQKTFSIKHRCETTRNTDGFGISSTFSTELYTRVMIEKIG